MICPSLKSKNLPSYDYKFTSTKDVLVVWLLQSLPGSCHQQCTTFRIRRWRFVNNQYSSWTLSISPSPCKFSYISFIFELDPVFAQNTKSNGSARLAYYWKLNQSSSNGCQSIYPPCPFTLFLSKVSNFSANSNIMVRLSPVCGMHACFVFSEHCD